MVFGDRSYRTVGPWLWNALPLEFRKCESVELSQVKMIYFSGTQCIQQENQHDVHI